MKYQLTSCNKCGVEIHFDTLFISFTKSIEKAHFTNRIEVEVLDSEQLVTLCKKCGDDFNPNLKEYLETTKKTSLA